MAPQLKLAVICSSNMNRSMEAHNFLSKKGYRVQSFGTGDKVKLPGSAPDRPNVYECGTPYDDIYQDLLQKDRELCEERVYDQVIENLESRDSQTTPVHVINIEIQDNHEEATIGAFLICELVALLANSDDLDNDIDELLQDFEAKCSRPVLHCVLFY
nr:EOG090X0E4R [Chydorus sphaericus]